MVSFFHTLIFSVVAAVISVGVYFTNLKDWGFWSQWTGFMAYVPIVVGAVVILLAFVLWKKSGKKK